MMASHRAESISMPSSIELPTLNLSTEHISTEEEIASPFSLPSRAQSALPPTDEGLGAWISLAGAFSSNALIWGFALSFGVMQEFYTNHEPFSSRPEGIAAIGTTCTGLMYLTMPIFLWSFQRWPRARQWSMYASLPMVTASLIGASFAETVPQLIACQGILYALAGNALVMPTINFINEWFVRKKGLAIGIAIAGDGFGGIVMPLLLQGLLGSVGFRWALRIVAAIIVVLSAPLIFFIKPRLPISATHVSPRLDTSFLKKPMFWTFELFNTIQALGYFLPVNYLPSIAETLGLSATLGSLTVLMVNLGLVFGCIGVGSLVDRFDVTTVMLFVGAISSIAVFCILGFTTYVAPLYIFSLMYGMSAGAYSTNWGGMIKEIQKRNEGADANLVFGLLAAGRGVGSIISGPLSESLLADGRVWRDAATSAYSSEYGPIIIFSGCTALVGGFSWFVRRAGII